MFKVNNYSDMEEFISQFNMISSNGDLAIPIRYLIYNRWNVNVSKVEKLVSSFKFLCDFDHQKLDWS